MQRCLRQEGHVARIVDVDFVDDLRNDSGVSQWVDADAGNLRERPTIAAKDAEAGSRVPPGVLDQLVAKATWCALLMGVGISASGK